MSKITKAQKIALDVFMEEYPVDLDFKTNLNKIANNGESDSDIIVCDYYKNIDRNFLVMEIAKLACEIQNAIDQENIKFHEIMSEDF